MRIDLSVVVVELPQHLKAGLRVGYADLVQQFKAVHLGVGKGNVFHNAPAYLCPPGEIGAQLAVAHVPVGGVVGEEIGAFGCVVGEVLQQLCLPQKQFVVGIVILVRTLRQLFGICQRFGQAACHLRRCPQDPP